MGIEDEHSHPWKMAVTPRSHVTDAETGGFIFFGVSLKLNQTSETTFKYLQSQYAD